MAVATKVSIEEFEQMQPPVDGRLELVHGEVVKLTFPTPIHNLVCLRVARLLAEFAEPRNLGLVLPADTGFVLSREDATLRGPDAAFLTAARAAQIDLRRNIEGAPDLAIEVISPSDTISGMREKVEQYLAAGCRAVWVLDPDATQVEVYERNERPRILIAEDTIECPGLLPGFAMRVAELFPPAQSK